MTIKERILARVIYEPNGCWHWRGSPATNGRPHMHIGKRMRFVSVVAYEEWRGPVPPGAVLDHICRDTTCISPYCLDPCSQSTNRKRGILLNSLKTCCPKGHPYSEENTWISKKGWRYCKACRHTPGNQKGRSS